MGHLITLAFAFMAFTASSATEHESTRVASSSSDNATESSLGTPDNAHAVVIANMKDVVSKRIEQLKDDVVLTQGSIPRDPNFLKVKKQLGAGELYRIAQLVTKIGNTAKTAARGAKRRNEILAIVLGPTKYSSEKLQNYADKISAFGKSSVEKKAVKFVSGIISDYVKTQQPSTHDVALLQVAELVGSAGESMRDVARGLAVLAKLDEYELTPDEKEFVKKLAFALDTK